MYDLQFDLTFFAIDLMEFAIICLNIACLALASEHEELMRELSSYCFANGK